MQMSSMSWDELSEIKLTDWKPLAQVSVPQSRVPRSLVPSIDIHNHLGRWLSDSGDWMYADVSKLVDVMDAANVAMIVNLDGMWGDEVTARMGFARPAGWRPAPAGVPR
jgi:hypothetical protein